MADSKQPRTWRPKSRPGRGARPDQRFRPKSPSPGELDDDIVRLYGIHPVEAALGNPARTVRRLLMTDNAARRLSDALSRRDVTIEPTTPRDLDRMLGTDTVHQGVMMETDPLPEPSLQDLAEAAQTGGPLVVLDQVTDPHNVGAVVRSAAVFGASGIIMHRRHSAPLNGTLAKSASGALELVPIALVQNLARALDELKDAGVRVIGLDGEGTTLIDEEAFTDATAVVLGAEGKGLRQLTRETCHAICRIAAPGPIASLNVSNAAAVTLHLSVMRRRAAGR